MEDEKWWLDSQTIQGTLMALVPTVIVVLKMFGIEVGNDEAGTIVSGIVGIIGAYGAMMAIEGRFKANGKITVKKP